MRFKYAFVFLTSLTLLNFSCSNAGGGSNSGIDANDAAGVVLGPEKLDVSPATLAECPGGGNVYSVYHDQNANDVFDSSDVLINSQVVCKAVNGTNGHSTLVSTSRVAVGFSACASGSGLQINFGLDTNDSGLLDASEITQTEVVCDGVTGSTGADGQAGSNGYSMVFAVAPASVQDCPAGGSTIVMALDVDRSQSITPADQNIQSMTLCNGVAGQNGQNATPTAYTPVEPILACGDNVAYKEVLLRLSDGQVLGSFSDNTSGSMTRLAFIPDGTFMNTDSSGCVFSLSTSVDGSTRSMSWEGAVQMTWPLESAGL